MAAITEARQQLIDIINAEFAFEGFTAEHDELHESLGSEGTRIGVSPVRQYPAQGRYIQQEMEFTVRFFDYWVKEINPNQAVDPTRIEDFAERLQIAIESANKVSTNAVWYYNLTGIEYPRDPTGNKTRFIASITAYGNNPTLHETA